MVPSRTTNRDVVVMAKHIAMDQQAQIDTLQGLLQQWGEPAAPDHTGHEGMSMDGMVDAATMDRLPTLKNTAFDELWLRSMITHHQGAVAMAQPEIVRGENPTAVKMARSSSTGSSWRSAECTPCWAQRSDVAPTRQVIDTPSACGEVGHDNL